MKTKLLILLLIVAVFLLVACGGGSKSTPDKIKDKMSSDLVRFDIPSSLKDFTCEENTDGLYITCTVKYTGNNPIATYNELYMYPYLDELFTEYPELESMLIELQGIEDGHVYSNLYVRNGDTYEIVDELQVK